MSTLPLFLSLMFLKLVICFFYRYFWSYNLYNKLKALKQTPFNVINYLLFSIVNMEYIYKDILTIYIKI